MPTKITKKAVDAAVCGDGRLYLFDTDVKGFGLQVTAAGAKTYFVQYRAGLGGRSAPKRRYTIGPHGSPWTPDTAREEAKRILGLAAAGQDPAAEKVRARETRSATGTVEDAIERYVERYAKRHQRSWKETERILRKDVLPIIGKKLVTDVTQVDVVRLLDRLEETGPMRAFHALSWTRALFSWLLGRHEVPSNPCLGIRLEKAKARERVLSDGEIAEIWRAAEALDRPWGHFAKFLLVTGQRRGEVAGMRHSETDESGWSIPAARTKNGRPHVVPLVKAARDIVQQFPKFGEGFVFTTNGTSPISGFSAGKARLDKAILAARKKAAAECGDDCETVVPMQPWTWHDLRRTMATGMARLGIAPHIIERILNHSATKGAVSGLSHVWETYSRHDFAPEMVKALERWESHILGLVEGRASADNVVAMRRS